LNIAIFTPNHNPYSETFIQTHKKYLKDKVFYYYGYGESIQLENHGYLISDYRRWYLKLKAKLLRKPINSVRDSMILTSLKQHNIDAILVEYGNHALNLLSVLKICRLPFVVHFHGYDASRHDVIQNSNHYKDVFALATKVVAVSKIMESMLLNLGCPRDKLVYNVYGPQPEFHDVQPLYTEQQFIGIGRFTDKKAPYYTIMAFRDVLQKHPKAKLLLAGNGMLLNTCKNLVNTFGIQDNVTFLGVIEPEDYRNYLSESLAFIQHSITADNGDMEGTPLAILEASAAGLPVVSTNHAGIPDVIVHGETGLLCEEHDVATMTDNMLGLLDDVSFARTLGFAGKHRIKKQFSMRRHINQLQDILENAISEY